MIAGRCTSHDGTAYSRVAGPAVFAVPRVSPPVSSPFPASKSPKLSHHRIVPAVVDESGPSAHKGAAYDFVSQQRRIPTKRHLVPASHTRAWHELVSSTWHVTTEQLLVATPVSWHHWLRGLSIPPLAWKCLISSPVSWHHWLCAPVVRMELSVPPLAWDYLVASAVSPDHLVTAPWSSNHLDGFGVGKPAVTSRADIGGRYKHLYDLVIKTVEKVPTEAACVGHGDPGVAAGWRVVVCAPTHSGRLLEKLLPLGLKNLVRLFGVVRFSNLSLLEEVGSMQASDFIRSLGLYMLASYPDVVETGTIETNDQAWREQKKVKLI